MNLFSQFTELCAELPDAVVFLVCPALTILLAAVLCVFGARRIYALFALILTGAESFLVACKDPSLGFCAMALMFVLSGIAAFLFCIPLGRKRKKDVSKELYEKFALPLEAESEEPAPDEELYDKEECGLRLSHTIELLEKLKKSDLSASDRLEADSLSQTLEAYRDRELSALEMRTLNDCLATVLKLTAKYKL